MEQIEITNEAEMLSYAFAILMTPEKIDGDKVIYDKETILNTLKGLDVFITQCYNIDSLDIDIEASFGGNE